MSARRQTYYVAKRYKKEGGEEMITRCIFCDAEMEKIDGVDILRKVNPAQPGIVYRIWGWRCPKCGNIWDDHSELVGPEY